MHASVKFCVSLLILNQISEGDGKSLEVKIEETGAYSFTAGGNPEFHLNDGDAFLQANMKHFSTSDGTLKLSNHKNVAGTDVNGRYEGMVFSYEAGTASMENQILVYDGGRFVRFTQSFPKGVQQSNISDTDSILSSFPSFSTKKGLDSAGFIHLNGDMCGASYSLSNFTSGSKMLHSGQEAGPIAIFDGIGNAMIISAYSNFMAHSMIYDGSTEQLQFGIMGGYTNIPVHYQIDTILYYGSDGINRAIEGWGEVISGRYGKTRMYKDNDLTIKYIGYWTDAGAFYYYNTEKNKTYEQTMLDVLHYAEAEGIPYRYIQYDSWWYFKGAHDGVKEWVAMPSVFPNGTVGLFEEHGMPVGAHNRYWASDNVYPRQNGGKYSFIIDNATSTAVPDDVNFWPDLLHNATKWGLRMYEQDWDDVEFEKVSEFHTNINLGKEWLFQMGSAAETHGMTVQYCMALSRHMLQSVEIPAVTQARVSGDYRPGNDQWKIGVTSMFAHSLHLAPFKDTFWTTSQQTGSPYGTDEEHNPTLQAAIATFSTGPVGPSDSIGRMSFGILPQTYRSDGLLLKPSRAITLTDRQIINRAFPGKAMAGVPNVEAEIYTTYTEVSYSAVPHRHGYVLVTDLTVSDFKVYPENMYLETGGRVKNYLAYHGHPGDDAQLIKFNATSGLTIPKCGQTDFQLWYAAPIIVMSNGNRVAVLGERGKLAPVSEQRISNIEHKMDNLLVDLAGAANEFVQFGFSVNETVVFVNCNISPSGQARISLNARTCFQ